MVDVQPLAKFNRSTSFILPPDPTKLTVKAPKRKKSDDINQQGQRYLEKKIKQNKNKIRPFPAQNFKKGC